MGLTKDNLCNHMCNSEIYQTYTWSWGIDHMNKIIIDCSDDDVDDNDSSSD